MPAIRSRLVDVFLNCETFTQVHARGDGTINEHLVEGTAPRAIAGGHALEHQVFAHEPGSAGIQSDRRRRRATGSHHPVEETPFAQASRAVPVDEVPVRSLARNVDRSTKSTL
jgi:hypothetical protein